MAASILSFGRKADGGNSQPPGKRASAPADVGSPSVELIADPSGNRTKLLAVGLRWRSIVVAPAEAQAIEQSRKAKATHFQISGYVFGHCKLDRGQALLVKNGAAIYPAARLAAKRFGQNALVALALGAGEIWICQIRAGVPAGVDEVVQGEIAAEKRITELLASYPEGSGVRVHSDLSNLGSDPIFAKFGDLFTAQAVASDRLEAVPGKNSIPKPILFGLIAALVLVGGQQAWKSYDAIRKAETKEAAREADVDPAVLWQKALDVWIGKQVMVSGGQLEPVLNSLTAVPARWYGWRLSEATCQVVPGGPGAAAAEWVCQALYSRTPTGKVNTQMRPKIPATYQVSFTPLEGMQIGWTIKTSARWLTSVDVAKLPSKASHFIDTSAALQTIAPALATSPRYVFTAPAIELPKTAKGVPIKVPPDFGMSTATLSIDGPLRSLMKASSTDIPAAWLKVVVRLNTAEVRTSLTASALTGTLIGTLYANK